jgi:hypothetical protein
MTAKPLLGASCNEDAIDLIIYGITRAERERRLNRIP